MKLNYLLRIILLISFFSNAQAPVIEWQKCLGGTLNDYSGPMIETTDGGYIIAGYSFSNNGDVTVNHGDTDYWIVKLNSTGDIQWQKSFGGINKDNANSIIQTTDGGYIIAGQSASNDGDVTVNYGNFDYWIVKLNSTGDIQWQKSFGGSNYDNPKEIIQTTDGGYIIAGFSYLNNSNMNVSHGLWDYWIIKLNSTGNIQWQKLLGGTDNDYANSIIQTIDGGYIVAGNSKSINGDVTANHGAADYWIVKLNSTGDIQWQKSFGGTLNDNLSSIIQTTDGGYIVLGGSKSNNGDVSGNHGGLDTWIIKLNSTGDIQWQKSFGGTLDDASGFIIQITDDGYIITGNSYSNNGDVSSNQGGLDAWIVKMNLTGDIQWQKSFGGTLHDYSGSIIQTTNGGYIVCGASYSNNGDVLGNHGGSDVWIVKLAPDNLSTDNFIENTTITLFPNPTKENLTLKLNYFTPSQEITITDIQGKIIHNQKLDGLSTTINTSSFEKGIYFLNLIDGSQKTTKKFIVE